MDIAVFVSDRQVAYSMTMQMVDIFFLSFYFLATDQHFASPLYVGKLL